MKVRAKAKDEKLKMKDLEIKQLKKLLLKKNKKISQLEEKKRKISVLNLVEGTTNCILNPVEHHENHLDPVEETGKTRDGFFEGGITQTNSI